MTQLKYTKEQIKELMSKHKTFAAMASVTGTSRQNMYLHCRRYGVQSEIGKLKQTKDDKNGKRISQKSI